MEIFRRSTLINNYLNLIYPYAKANRIFFPTRCTITTPIRDHQNLKQKPSNELFRLSSATNHLAEAISFQEIYSIIFHLRNFIRRLRLEWRKKITLLRWLFMAIVIGFVFSDDLCNCFIAVIFFYWLVLDLLFHLKLIWSSFYSEIYRFSSATQIKIGYFNTCHKSLKRIFNSKCINKFIIFLFFIRLSVIFLLF